MQNFMRQFTIRFRMIGAIAVVLALLASVGGAGLWGMSRLSAVADEFSQHAFRETTTLSHLKAAMGEIVRHEKDMVIAYEKPEQVAAAKAKWQAAYDDAVVQAQGMLAGEEDADRRAPLVLRAAGIGRSRRARQATEVGVRGWGSAPASARPGSVSQARGRGRRELASEAPSDQRGTGGRRRPRR